MLLISTNLTIVYNDKYVCLECKNLIIRTKIFIIF